MAEEFKIHISPLYSEKEKVKVSVVLLTYNHEKYISQALDSVLMQKTSFNFEIIVIEDCSSDNTRSVLFNYFNKYPLKLVLADRNLNSHKYFVDGLKLSKGEYIALLDGDDYWTSKYKLQKQIDYLDQHSECSICFHNAEVFHEDSEIPVYNFNSKNQKEISTIEDLWSGNFIATCSVIFRAKVINNIPDWYYNAIYGDWELHLINAQYGKIGYMNEVMGRYRIHKGGYWSGRSEIQKLKEYIKFFDLMNKNTEYKYDRDIKLNLSNQYLLLAKNLLQSKEIFEGKKYLFQYFKKRPVSKWFNKFSPYQLLIKLYTGQL